MSKNEYNITRGWKEEKHNIKKENIGETSKENSNETSKENSKTNVFKSMKKQSETEENLDTSVIIDFGPIKNK
ncbi:MAG TPA: hypothetical protein VLL98_01860 [Rickettsiales bacterium]|nr:hypothetical protein [Rickettsiales bacterium]